MINHPISEVHNCDSYPYGGFHSHGDTPIAGWFIMENPIKLHDLGVPLFRKPPYDVILRVIRSYAPVIMARIVRGSPEDPEDHAFATMIYTPLRFLG